MNAKDWWEYYCEGKIILREDTPQSICSTMEDWVIKCCLSHSNPMWLFARGKPVEPRKLQREIEECVHSDNNLTQRQREDIKAVEVWAIREAALADAAKELREAERALYQAASAAGLDDYHTYKIATGPGV